MNAHISGRNVVVTVTGNDSDDSRKAARKAACGEAHTATIGKLLKVDERMHGDGFRTTYTWGPVTPRGTRKAAAPVDDAVAAEIAELRARLAELTGERPADVARATAAVARETFAPIAKRAAVKAAAACRTCTDLGHVRKTPRDNGSVAYRTAKGRDASIALGNATPCTAKGCKAGKAAAKAAAKAA